MGSRACLETLVKEIIFVTMFFLFSSLIVSVLRQRQYYKLLVTTGINVNTIRFNTKTVPGQTTLAKLLMFSPHIFCPDWSVDREIIKHELAVCSLLLLQCELLTVYMLSHLIRFVLRFELRWFYRFSFSYKRDVSVCVTIYLVTWHPKRWRNHFFDENRQTDK